jgi:RND family efflux transporter MFP subunit
VRKGDLLVEFDLQNQRKIVLDRQAEYRDLIEQIRKREAQQDADRTRQVSELKQAENTLESAKLEAKKNEVLIRIDAEKNNLAVEEAEARLKQLRETVQLRDDAAKSEIRILEIQRDRARNAVEYAEKNIDRMQLTSPLDGLVVLIPFYKSGRMAEAVEGDEVRPGVPFMRVVDPKAMQVRARINQADIYDLAVGQTCELRLDAFPELVFHGRVEEVGAIAGTSQLSRYVRAFTSVISIAESHPKLMPDLSAAVDIEFCRLKDALPVPRESIELDEGSHYVRVLKQGKVERRPVKLGPSNELEAVVESGLAAGDVIERALSAGRNEVTNSLESAP